jgi:hypothetical protein
LFSQGYGSDFIVVSAPQAAVLHSDCLNTDTPKRTD